VRALPFSLVLALTPAAFGQAFVDGAAQLPTSPGSNNSSTENVDWADVDLDGDFDALFADGGASGNDQNRLWINQGGAQAGAIGFFLDETSAQYPAFLDESRDVDFADIDADGDADVLVSNTSHYSDQSNQIVVNQGGLQGGTAGFFANETSTRWVNIGVNNGTTSFSSVWPALVLASGGFMDHSGDTVLGDLDADGDMDILHSSYGDPLFGAFTGKHPHRIFLNDGLGFFEEFNPSGFQLGSAGQANGVLALWASGVQQHDTTNTNGQESDIATTAVNADLGDLDGDFDLDLVLGARDEQPRLFRNGLAGGVLPPFVDITAGAFSELTTGGFHYEQEFGDVDNDDDLDLYGVNWNKTLFSKGDVVMLNDGSFGFGPFVSVPSSTGDDEEADFLDYDGDGDLDVFVASFAGSDRLYANQGDPGGYTLTLTSGQLPPNSGTTTMGVDSVDIDLDGDQDLMIANADFEGDELLVNVTATADPHAPRVIVELVSDPGCNPAAVAVRANVFDNASWEWTRYNTTELGVSVDGGPLTAYPMRFSGGQTWRGEIPAGTVGMVAYRVRSTDREGNVGLSPTLTYTAVSVESYCTAGTSASGCAALLSSTGVPSVSAGSGFTVDTSSLEGQKDGLYFYGFNGAQASSWGNGTSYQCVVPPVIRTPLLTGVGSIGLCDGSFSLDFSAYWATAVPAKIPAPGQQVNVQLWYRDPASTSNQTTSLSDALEFTACP
jgi:hypothetical protein